MDYLTFFFLVIILYKPLNVLSIENSQYKSVISIKFLFLEILATLSCYSV